MITYKQLVEKKLTNAEKRKREEIAKAIERDTPDMAMDKKMAIATATAKRVAEANEKDPEEYDNEGSMMKGQLRQICSANEKLMKMVKDEDNLPEWVQSKVTKATDYIRSVRDYLESEKMADTNESVMVKDKSADKKAELVTLPDGKRAVRMVPTQKKQVAESLEEMVQHLEELTAAELKLINQMYDKKGNLTPMGKKVMAHGKSNSKLTPKNRDADNARRKEYNAYQKSKRNEAVDVEEALERDGPKKPDIFGPKGSFGKSASTTPAVQKYMAKRAAANQARNKAMDPGADKKGYGIGVTDTAKADKKAKAKGTSMMKRMGSRGKMYKAGKMM